MLNIMSEEPKSFEGLGYRIEPHRAVFVFEMKLKAQEEPTFVAVVKPVTKGFWESIQSTPASAHDFFRLSVLKIVIAPEKFFELTHDLIEYLIPVSWEKFMKHAGEEQNPMKVDLSGPEIEIRLQQKPKQSDDLFGRN